MLETLSRRQLMAGLAEAIKMAATSSAELFEIIEKSEDLDADLPEIIRRSLCIKRDVVEQDPKENGLRRILNFGHTMAHAIEKETGYLRYNHGEAVAIGMVGAADISARLGMIEEADVARVTALIERLHLPTVAEGCTVDAMYQDIFHDKKTINGKVNWVLMEGIGKVTCRNDVPEDVVRAAMAARIGK